MALGNLYHLLTFIPATEAWAMPPGLERAAQQLLRSGRLRINADIERNFVRLGTADTDATFTARELNDPALLPRTHALLAKHVAPAAGAGGLAELLNRLKRDLVKARGVSAEKEIKVARVLVQSADPAVIQLLLDSGAEIFVSYAHNVGDLMAVHDWDGHGLSGGLQATETSRQQVFVSCGGDPFFEGEHKHYVTDGWPALARMVVIGAQELGHFADLIRQGRAILGRYSLSDIARDSRRRDLAHLAAWRARVTEAGLPALQRAEASLAFYHKRARFTPLWLYWRLRSWLAWQRLRADLRSTAIPLQFRTYPAHRPGEALTLFLDDMQFNLAPDADAYRRADPAEEEAIATIEAVARVPQQAMKWGRDAVHAAWPHLAPFYDSAVLTACRAAATGPIPRDVMSFSQRVKRWLRSLRHPKPGYHP